MIVLQDHHAFSDIALFDPATRRIERRKRKPGEAVVVSGWIGAIGDKETLIYKDEGVIRLFIEGQDIPAEGTEAGFTSSDGENRLTLLRAGEVVTAITYRPSRISPPINDVLSPGEELENYDFGVFIHNLLNDPDRLRVCEETWV